MPNKKQIEKLRSNLTELEKNYISHIASQTFLHDDELKELWEKGIEITISFQNQIERIKSKIDELKNIND